MDKSLKVMLTVALFGAATWVAAMLSGQLIVLATGVPASSGLLNGFVVPFLLVLGLRAVSHPWHVTIAFATYGVLAIPTVLLGPPGGHKLIVALFAGFAADLLLRALGRRLHHSAYALALGLWALVLVVLARLAFEIEALQLPGKEQFIAVFPVMAAVFFVEAVGGAALASFLYDRRNLSDRPAIQTLQSWLKR